ncbi:MAG: hypothetical protein QMB11_09950 [Nonlabens sp.]|uniref:patatin-like phospholipase family protein n=1 Tax=Nonlabens sp. TaxID=1888209 RepID=UPI0035A65498
MKDQIYFTLEHLLLDKPNLLILLFTDQISQYIPENSFESLPIPLSVTATDLHIGELKIFKKGELYVSILASAAFPGIFTPIEIDGNLFRWRRTKQFSY